MESIGVYGATTTKRDLYLSTAGFSQRMATMVAMVRAAMGSNGCTGKQCKQEAVHMLRQIPDLAILNKKYYS